MEQVRENGDTREEGTPSRLAKLEADMREWERYHRIRKEQLVLTTARVELVETFLLDLTKALEAQRLDQLGALLEAFRSARKANGNPEYSTIDGERRSLPPPMPDRVSVVRAKAAAK